MPSNFSFFKFVMVNSSSLIFAFSLPLTIKWHLSKSSLSLFSLNQLKNGIRSSADLVTFTEEILNGKLHFLCSVAK